MVVDALGPYKPLSIASVPVAEWKQFIFEGTASIADQPAILLVNPDLMKRTIYLHVTPNLDRFGQTVFYATMNFYYRGNLLASELWRSAAAVVSGDNRPNKNTVTSLNTVYTEFKNGLTISFPTLANLRITPFYYEILCDKIELAILREKATTGAVGRIFLGCRSQTLI